MHDRQGVGERLAGLPGGEQGKGRAGALDMGFFPFQRGERLGEGAPAERGISLVAQVFDGFGGQLQCAPQNARGLPSGKWFSEGRLRRRRVGVLRPTGKPERTGIFQRGSGRHEGDGVSAGDGFGEEL